MASVLSRIQIILEANTANYNNELRRARENSDSTFKKMGKTAGKMAIGAGVAIAGLGITSLKVAGNFEQAMGGVQAVSGAVGKDFDDLRNKAKELGASTAYSATEAANGMEFLAMAGMNTKQVLDTIPNALALASAGGLELAASADIMSNIMTGMGLKAEDSGRAADVLAMAASKSNVSVSMLGETMKYAAPVAKQLGMELEETAAWVGVMGNAGIQASMAGTSLRSIFSRIATNDKAKEHFANLGIELKKADGSMRSMTDITEEYALKTKDLDSDVKLAMNKDIAGVEAMTAYGVVVDGIADGSLPKLEKELLNSEGAAQKMADIRMSGLNGSIKGLSSAWEGFLIELSDGGALDFAAKAVQGLTGFLRDMTAGIPDLIKIIKVYVFYYNVVGKLKTVFETVKTALENVGSAIKPVIDFFREHEELSTSLAIAIGIVALGFGAYTLAVAGAALAMTAFATVMAVATAPLTLILVAITAVVAAGVYLYRNWDTIKEKGLAVWQSLKDSVSNFVSGVVQGFVNFKDSVVNVFNNILTFIGSVWQSVKDTAIAVFNGLPEPVQQMARNIFSVFTAIQTAITVTFEFVSSVIGAVVGYISEQWNTFTAFFSSTTDSAKESVGSAFDSMAESIGETLASIGEFFKPMIEGAKVALDFVSDIFSSGFEIVKNIVSIYIETAINIFKGGLDGFLAIAEAAISLLATAFNIGFDLIKNIFSTAFEVIKAVLNGDMQGVVTAFRTGLDNAKNIVIAGLNTVLGIFKTLGSKLYTIGKNIIEGFINGVKEKFSGAIKAVSGFVSSIKNAFTSSKGLDIHSPSRVTKEYGKNTGDGFTIGLASTIGSAIAVADTLIEGIKSSFDVMKNYQLIENKENLNKSIFEANKSVIGSIQALRKEIVLFGNDSKLAAFEYEVAFGSLRNASKEYLDEYKKGLIEIARLEANDTATKSLAERLKGARAIKEETTKNYDTLKDGLITEEEKRLQLLKEQLAVITAMGNVAGSDDVVSKILGGFGKLTDFVSIIDKSADNTESQNQTTAFNANVKTSEDEYSGQRNTLQGALYSEDTTLEQKRMIQEQITQLEAEQSLKRRQYALDEAEIAKTAMQERLDFTGSVYSDMTSLVTAFTGENSRASKAMFAVQKAHSIAMILLKAKESMAVAMASAPFPANLPAMGMVALKTGVLVAQASGLTGQAHDGLSNIPKEGTYLLDKNERVVKPSDNNKLTKFLDSNANGSGQNITTHVTITGNSATVESNNAMGKELGNAINAAIQKQLRTELKQGGMLSR